MFKQNTGRKLTMSYVIALLVIGSLASVDFVIQRVILNDSEATQRIKDITATQRTLVQSIAFLSQSITLERNVKDKEARRYQLNELLTRLDRSLELMDQDFKELKSLAFPFAENLTPLYYTEALGLRRELDEFRDHVAKVVLLDVRNIHSANPHIRYIIDTAENELYSILDMFVTLTVLDTQKRLKSLGAVDTVAYGFVLVILLFTGLFIFRPVVAAVVRQQNDQTAANERLGERAEALEQSRGNLRKQTRILKSVLNTMGDALIVVDEEGRLLMQNPSADRLFGNLEEGTSRDDWHRAAGLCDPETNEPFSLEQGPVFRALNGKRFNEYLIKVQNNVASTAKIVSATGRKMVDEESNLSGAVISFHDVSDRILKEQELMESKIRAESANISKTQFLANISHEIRTPMGAILGYADRLLIGSLSSAERQDIVQVIRRNGRNLMNIIDDLLDISRVEAGQLAIEKQDLDPVDILSEVYSLLVNKAEEKGLQFCFSFEGPVPVRIHTDPIRLRQVLINVVGNAIKFTEQGSVDVKVRLAEKTELAQPRIEFEVSDTGCGIRQENTHKLFKPFAQVDSSTTRRFGGTGLGLNLSRRLAKALGGDLILTRTEYGQGSTFTVYVDPGDINGVARVGDLCIRPTSPTGTQEQFETMFPASGLEGAKILIVDDGEENRELFSYYLTRAGADVLTASDGQEGFETALKHNLDLVLLDIQMPKLDGYQTVARLREENYRAPIVALTAHAMKEEKERCRVAGFDDHLAKPIDAKNLVAACLRYVAIYRKESAAREDIVGTYSETPKNVINIRQGGHKDVPGPVKDIINRFVHSLPEKIEEMRNAIHGDDRLQFTRLVHRLKGTAGACGFMELMAEMESIEQLLVEKKPSTELFPKIERIEHLVPKEYKGVLG